MNTKLYEHIKTNETEKDNVCLSTSVRGRFNAAYTVLWACLSFLILKNKTIC